MICKKEKINFMWEAVAKRCSAKMLSEKFHTVYREIYVLKSLSNTAKGLQIVRLTSSLSKVSEPAIRIYKIGVLE